GGDGQSAAGAVAANGNLVERDAAVEQALIGGDAVVDRGGEGMLRRQAVIGREDRQTAVGAERPQHVAMRSWRADDIAAAMEIEHSGIVALHMLAAHPLAGN